MHAHIHLTSHNHYHHFRRDLASEDAAGQTNNSGGDAEAADGVGDAEVDEYSQEFPLSFWINPRIEPLKSGDAVDGEAEFNYAWEGCLSVPGRLQITLAF
jgi:hypothetical protein